MDATRLRPKGLWFFDTTTKVWRQRGSEGMFQLTMPDNAEAAEEVAATQMEVEGGEGAGGDGTGGQE